MPQYLLSIYQPVGSTPDAETMAQVTSDLDRLNDELATAGAWVFDRRPARPEHRHRRAAADGEVLMTDGPYVEGKEHIGGFWVIDSARPGRGAGWGRKAGAPRPGCRSRSGRSRTAEPFMTDGARPGRSGLPRRVRPRGRRPGPRLRRHRPRRGGGPGRVRRRRAALAGRRPAAQPGRLDHHHRPQPGDRPPAPRVPAARRTATPQAALACTPTATNRRRGGAPCATTGCG